MRTPGTAPGTHLVSRLAAALAVVFVVLSPVPSFGAADERPDAPAPDREPLFLLNDGETVESSGLAVSHRHHLLWTHNDAGHDATVYGLGAWGGIKARVAVQGASAEDWEDIATPVIRGEPYVYVADVGDAYAAREERGVSFRRRFEIVRFVEPEAVRRGDDLTVTAEVFPVVFEDREGVNVEAMAVGPDGRILLFEKLEKKGDARVWEIAAPSVGRRNTPSAIAELPLTGISGADMSVDGGELVVRTDAEAYVFDVTAGVAEALSEMVPPLELPAQRQGEAVAFTSDGRGLVISSEGNGESVWFLPLEPNASLRLGPPPAPQPDADTDASVSADFERAPLSVWLVGAAVALVVAVAASLSPGRRRGRSTA